ncbi:hypothetical protein MTR72_24040 [Bradyrhizobium sp. ISRA442]|uniref:hypothetical protein n=1 Tax=Bradyrhizobium sp. ISRA442 TaxID=2866197 RepID=UPI00311AE28A
MDNQLPDPIPVSKAELDAIEQHFGDLLDGIFESQSRTVPAVATASQKGDRR